MSIKFHKSACSGLFFLDEVTKGGDNGSPEVLVLRRVSTNTESLVSWALAVPLHFLQQHYSKDLVRLNHLELAQVIPDNPSRLLATTPTPPRDCSFYCQPPSPKKDCNQFLSSDPHGQNEFVSHSEHGRSVDLSLGRSGQEFTFQLHLVSYEPGQNLKSRNLTRPSP